MIRIFNQLVSLKTVVLIQTEALLILSCFITAAKLWVWNDPSRTATLGPWPVFLGHCFIQIVLLQVCFYCNGLYRIQNDSGRMQHLAGLLRAAGSLWLFSVA